MRAMIVLTLLLGGLFTGAVAITSTAWAGEPRTVILDVDNMTCGMCPITVRKALKKVPGVSEVEAKYEGGGVGWAKVTFDPDNVDVQALMRATEQAGYPSRPKP